MAPDRRGLVLASGAALLIGVGLTLMDRAGEHGALSAILVERATEAVVLVVLVAVLRRRVAADLRRPGAVPLVGWIDVSAASLYVLATQEGLLPVVSVLASLYPAVTVLLARLFLGERLSRTQARGAAVTLAGVALVAGTG